MHNYTKYEVCVIVHIRISGIQTDATKFSNQKIFQQAFESFIYVTFILFKSNKTVQI